MEMADLLRTGRALGTPTTRDSASSTDWLYQWLSRYTQKRSPASPPESPLKGAPPADPAHQG